MYIRRNVKLSVILWFSGKHLVFFTLLSTAVFFAYHMLGYAWLSIPFLPVGTIGTAVAFYVGFKNNSSYERLWEARKIWGSITNLCRTWAMQVTSLKNEKLSKEALFDLHKDLIYRQIAWCQSLRIQLRRNTDRLTGMTPPEVELVKRKQNTNDFASEIQSYLSHYLKNNEQLEVESKTNIANEILRLQTAKVFDLKYDRTLNEWEQYLLIETVRNCVDQQGAAERIKTFPLPRQYASFSSVFVWIFMLMLPFSLVSEFDKLGPASWLAIPFSVLISWIFLTMEQVGDTSEDPFENGINDVPITAISRNIEIELLEMLGGQVLPERIAAVDDILL
jgi:putative membrane protein